MNRWTAWAVVSAVLAVCGTVLGSIAITNGADFARVAEAGGGLVAAIVLTAVALAFFS